MSEDRSFFSELKHRKVYQTGVRYLVVAGAVWGALEIASNSIGLPRGVLAFVIYASIAGFPLALILAWLYDVPHFTLTQSRWVAGAGAGSAVVLVVAVLWLRPWASAPPPPPLPDEPVFDQLTFSGLARGQQFSPDGQWLSYLEWERDSEGGRIRVIDLGTGDDVTVFEYDHWLRAPLWSPDGSRLAFQTGGARGQHRHGVYTVSRLGSDARLVYPIDDNAWPDYAWSPDASGLAVLHGSRLYVLDLSSPGVPRDSAVIEVLEPSDLSSSSLAWSPDGNWLAIEVRSRALGAARIVVVSAADGIVSDELVGPDDVGVPEWSDSGRWLFYRDGGAGGSVRRVDFDLATGTFGTVDVEVLAPPGGLWGYAVNEQTRRLSIERGSSVSSHIWRVALDGDGAAPGRAERVTEGTFQFGSPSVSPDGSTIAYLKYSDFEMKDLFVRGLDNGEERQVTRSGRVVRDSRWSPDGSKLAYGEQSDSGRFPMVVLLRDGVAERVGTRPTQHAGRDRQFAWAPDSNSLLYLLDGSGDFILLDLETGAEQELLEEGANEDRDVLYAQFAPDGRAVAVQVDSTGARPLLKVVQLDDRSTRTLLESAVPLAWSTPDTIHVIVDGLIVALSVSTGGSRALGLVPEWCGDFALAPDARSIFCQRGEDLSDIWISRPNSAGG